MYTFMTINIHIKYDILSVILWVSIGSRAIFWSRDLATPYPHI